MRLVSIDMDVGSHIEVLVDEAIRVVQLKVKVRSEDVNVMGVGVVDEQETIITTTSTTMQSDEREDVSYLLVLLIDVFCFLLLFTFFGFR